MVRSILLTYFLGEKYRYSHHKQSTSWQDDSIHSTSHHSSSFNFNRVCSHGFDCHTLHVSRNHKRMIHTQASILLPHTIPCDALLQRDWMDGRATLACVSCSTLLRHDDPVRFSTFDDSHLPPKVCAFFPKEAREVERAVPIVSE